MTFEPTPIPGCVVVCPDRYTDDRGHFARTWDGEAFAAAGLAAEVSQCSTSYNAAAGTLRGMHYQVPPHAEAKLVRCTRGMVWDVCLDLRADSPTFRRWHGETLSAENGRALVVPRGCAHGLLTLEDASEVLYMISGTHVPEAARGVRYDDPAFCIAWPAPVRVIHPRDAAYPLYDGGRRGSSRIPRSRRP